MKKYVLLILFGVFLITPLAAQKAPKIDVVSMETIKSEVIGKEVQFLDVRTPQEFAAGHIDGAINMNVMDVTFLEDIKTLDKTQPVYVYCHIGGRSNVAAQQLKANGFLLIYDYKGGYNGWSKQ